MVLVIALDLLAAQLEMADSLRAGKDTMLDPQDLPGRYGRGHPRPGPPDGGHALRGRRCRRMGGVAAWLLRPRHARRGHRCAGRPH